MDLYSKISQFYRDIFPLDETQSEFISGEFDSNKKKLLDAGCALGDLSFDLYKKGFKVWAFDSNKEMVNLANKGKKQGDHFPVFDQLDMLKIDHKYPSSFFDGIICFGNTLVHLQNENEIARFISSSYNTLNHNGKIFIQILNYEYILENRIKELPIIDTKRIRFERYYNYQSNDPKINFHTVLTIKEFDHKIINETTLYPIKPNKLISILETVGFNQIKYFGEFSKDVFSANNLKLVLAASK